MSLSSASRISDALAQYNDNLAWDGSVAKAKLALEAIRFLIANRALIKRDDSVYLSFADLAREKEILEAFVAGGDDAERSTFTRGVALL